MKLEAVSGPGQELEDEHVAPAPASSGCLGHHRAPDGATAQHRRGALQARPRPARCLRSLGAGQMADVLPPNAGCATPGLRRSGDARGDARMPPRPRGRPDCQARQRQSGGNVRNASTQPLHALAGGSMHNSLQCCYQMQRFGWRAARARLAAPRRRRRRAHGCSLERALTAPEPAPPPCAPPRPRCWARGQTPSAGAPGPGSPCFAPPTAGATWRCAAAGRARGACSRLARRLTRS